MSKHRLLIWTLSGALIAFSVWSLLLLHRAREIRHDLDLHFDWVDDLRLLRTELDRLRSATSDPLAASAGGEPDPAEDPWAEIEAAAQRSDERLDAVDDPDLGVAARNLRQALDRLVPEATAESTSDAVWDASAAAQHAADALEDHLQRRIALLHKRLGRHWTSLNLLVVTTLALCGSNLALLWVAHRRRLEIETAHSQALLQASHDPLTGLWNREAILRMLSRELVRAQRSDVLLGVILLDVEHFSQVNVLLGQDQGDYILQQISSRLQSLIRPYDTMGRYGGDSFLLVLPACDETATAGVAARLRQAVNGREFEHAVGRIPITANVASVVARATETDVESLLLRLHERMEEIRTAPSGPPSR